jgi:hypothetical protein
MAGDYTDTDAFRDARFTDADLRGAVFRACDLRGVKIVDAWLTDVNREPRSTRSSPSAPIASRWSAASSPTSRTPTSPARAPAPPPPGYPEEPRSVAQCLRVTMTEELEHHRYTTRDLPTLEAR